MESRYTKSTGAQKQTNTTRAAVIKSSLVFVMNSERSEAAGSLPALDSRHPLLTNRGQTLDLIDPCFVTQKPSVFPPQLARTESQVFVINFVQ